MKWKSEDYSIDDKDVEENIIEDDEGITTIPSTTEIIQNMKRKFEIYESKSEANCELPDVISDSESHINTLNETKITQELKLSKGRQCWDAMNDKERRELEERKECKFKPTLDELTEILATKNRKKTGNVGEELFEDAKKRLKRKVLIENSVQ